MNQLPLTVLDSKLRSELGQSAPADNTQHREIDRICDINVERNTAMPSQINVSCYKLLISMLSISELNNSIMVYHTAPLPTLDKENTEHRIGIPRILFSHMYTQIENAKEPEEVIGALAFLGFTDVAERLVYLHKIVKEEDESIILESLQGFALFMVREHKLPHPEIGITSDGFIQAVWRKPKYGTLAMNFLPSGDVTFAIVSYQQVPEAHMYRVNGVQPPHRVMYHVGKFIDGLMHHTQRSPQ